MDTAVDPLVAVAIHDAKNALQSLDTQLAEAERQSNKNAASADFSGARATVARVARQLTELLTLYRAQGGQLRLAIDDHDLNNFIDDLLTELGPLPDGIALKVERDAADSLGAWAFDAYLVKLALLDTLRNALRHARSSVTLSLQAIATGGICFAVVDDGPGFPELVLIGAAIQSGNQDDGGTGLGLTFARLIAAHHITPTGRCGRVELANQSGAILRIYLP
jgi:signal transduction histidine kinase